MDYRRENHSVSDLKVHLIFVAKYRQKVLSADGLTVIEDACRAVALKMDFQLLEFNGGADHVHLLVGYPPKLSSSQMVNALKGVSSRRYGQAGPPKPKGKAALWTPAHVSASVGGAPLEPPSSLAAFALYAELYALALVVDHLTHPINRSVLRLVVSPHHQFCKQSKTKELNPSNNQQNR